MTSIFIKFFLFVWHIFNLPMYLKVFVSRSTHACRDDQLYVGLKARINLVSNREFNIFGKLIKARQNGFFTC